MTRRPAGALLLLLALGACGAQDSTIPPAGSEAPLLVEVRVFAGGFELLGVEQVTARQARFLLRSADTGGLRYEVLDAAGTLLHAKSVIDPRNVDDGPRQEEGTLTLAIPPTATRPQTIRFFWLEERGKRELGALSLDAPSAVSSHQAALVSASTTFDVERLDPASVPSGTLVWNAVTAGATRPGDDQRIVIVVVGDGYRAADLADFRDHTDRIFGQMFQHSWYAAHRDFISVYRVLVTSNDTGVTYADECCRFDSSGACPPSRVVSPGNRDTAFGATIFGEFEPFTSSNRSLVKRVARAHVPAMDVPVLLVNNDADCNWTGGRSNRKDGVVTQTAMNGFTLAHELGHGIGNLGDEYVRTPCTPASERGERVNIKKTSDRDRLPWAALIDVATPLPTPDTAPYTAGTVGAFEGGLMTICDGVFRPTFDACLMNKSNSNTDFCPVCAIHMRSVVQTQTEGAIAETFPQTAAEAIGLGSVYCLANSAGQGIEISDINGGWNLAHRELDGRAEGAGSRERDFGSVAYKPLDARTLADVQQGTAVLGLMIAAADGQGITGMAPAARATVISTADGVAAAIDRAAATARAGRVITITGSAERTAGVCAGDSCSAPLELDPAVHDAIRQAVAGGAVVVEAAGSGGLDLDALLDREERDSGAIIVGATDAAAATSNRGSAIDIRAPAAGLATAGGAADAYPPAPCDACVTNIDYTDSFGSTAASAALAGGGIAALQSVAGGIGMGLEPACFRDLLRQVGPDLDVSRLAAELFAFEEPDASAEACSAIELENECETGGDCLSGLCQASLAGRRCATRCSDDEDCAAGESCVASIDGKGVHHDDQRICSRPAAGDPVACACQRVHNQVCLPPPTLDGAGGGAGGGSSSTQVVTVGGRAIAADETLVVAARDQRIECGEPAVPARMSRCGVDAPHTGGGVGGGGGCASIAGKPDTGGFPLALCAALALLWVARRRRRD